MSKPNKWKNQHELSRLLTNLKIADVYRREVIKKLDELQERYKCHINLPEKRRLYGMLRKKEIDYDAYISECKIRIKQIRPWGLKTFIKLFLQIP